MRSLLSALPLIALPLISLAACTAGPDYHGPQGAGAASPAVAFARAPEGTGGEVPAAANWWSALGDPVLDALESRALSANPGLAVAQARISQARAALRSERANSLPKGGASALYVHATIPGVDLNSSDGGDSSASGNDSQSLNFYNLGFDASWEADLWGGKRRGVEAARAQLGAAEA
ncbi:TolC family protein, partial [Sphingobium sp.]|uniref:TolC family protein n=1 Tax=Sphingobium sp. TaxID=1912891 RepID=UPI0035C7282F